MRPQSRSALRISAPCVPTNGGMKAQTISAPCVPTNGGLNNGRWGCTHDHPAALACAVGEVESEPDQEPRRVPTDLPSSTGAPYVGNVPRGRRPLSFTVGVSSGRACVASELTPAREVVAGPAARWHTFTPKSARTQWFAMPGAERLRPTELCCWRLSSTRATPERNQRACIGGRPATRRKFDTNARIIPIGGVEGTSPHIGS